MGAKKRKENPGESLKPEFVGLPDARVKDGFFVKPLGSEFKIKIRYDNIVWVEADNNYSHIHCRNAQCVSIALNIKKVEKVLSEHQFVRISRSEIINVHLVCKYCGNLFYLEGINRSFTVTQSYRDCLFACFRNLDKDD